MILDPVCLMKIDMREAEAMTVHEGRGYYFCSVGCRDTFYTDIERYSRNASAERLTVGVMGSAADESDEDVERRSVDLGEAIANQGLILITGACPGLPYVCAQETRARGGMSVGISPALSLDEHIHKYESPADAFDVVIYTGSGLMGREVTNIRSSDMVIIIGGRSGTLGEFSIAYDEGKLIGVLEGSGGIADQIPAIIESFGKDTGAVLIYERDPKQLIEALIESYSTSHFKHPSCYCTDHSHVGG